MNVRRLLAVAAAGLISTQATAQPGPTGTYTVDADASDVHWLIYRTGPLSRFGHNHVISVDRMTGTVEVAESWSDSSFAIEMPVDGLVVDDAELRAAQGEGFESEPSDEDVSGTRRNMLSESLLDGEQHPTLGIAGTAPTGTPADGEITLTVDVAGTETTVTAPVSVEFTDDGTLTAAGEFQLTHDTLGLEPFSALGGALRVSEEIDFTYRIVARRAAGRSGAASSR